MKKYSEYSIPFHRHNYLKNALFKESTNDAMKGPRLAIFKALNRSIENKILMLLQFAILDRAPLKCRVIMTVIDMSFVSMT